MEGQNELDDIIEHYIHWMKFEWSETKVDQFNQSHRATIVGRWKGWKEGFIAFVSTKTIRELAENSVFNLTGFCLILSESDNAVPSSLDTEQQIKPWNIYISFGLNESSDVSGALSSYNEPIMDHMMLSIDQINRDEHLEQKQVLLYSLLGDILASSYIDDDASSGTIISLTHSILHQSLQIYNFNDPIEQNFETKRMIIYLTCSGVMSYVVNLIEQCSDLTQLREVLRKLSYLLFNPIFLQCFCRSIKNMDHFSFEDNDSKHILQEPTSCEAAAAAVLKHRNMLAFCTRVDRKRLKEARVTLAFDKEYLKSIIEHCANRETIQYALDAWRVNPDSDLEWVVSLTELACLESVSIELFNIFDSNIDFHTIIDDSNFAHTFDWKQRNVCMLLQKLFKGFTFSQRLFAVTKCFLYVFSVFDKSTNNEVALEALLALELIVRKHLFAFKQSNIKFQQNKQKLLRLLEPRISAFDGYIKSCHPPFSTEHNIAVVGLLVAQSLRTYKPYTLYTLYDNVFILSPDRFFIHHYNDITGKPLLPARSLYHVNFGAYFYEVQLLSSGNVALGWTSQESMGIKFEGIFICYENFEFYLKDESNEYHLQDEPILSVGDVIGCLIDASNHKAVFFHNGNEIKLSNEMQLSLMGKSSQVYIAAAYLSVNQKCYFNFGQAPFHYPPQCDQASQFTDFHTASGSDACKYQLAEIIMLYGKDDNFAFYKPLIDNQVQLLFNDDLQQRCDRLIDEMQMVICHYSGEEVQQFIANRAQEFNTFGCIRILQSIVEVLSASTKLDIIAYWIGVLIENNIDRISLSSFYRLIYPYFKIEINRSNLTKHRNLFIIITCIMKFDTLIDVFKYFHCFELFYNILYIVKSDIISSNDSWNSLFALDLIERVSDANVNGLLVDLLQNEDWQCITSQFNQQQIEQSDTFPLTPRERISIWSRETHRIKLPMSLLIERFLNVFTSCDIAPLRATNVWLRPLLNEQDRTEDLYLSHSKLAAHGLWNRASIRSICDVNKRVFYHEAVVLTSGPMRIGWATQRLELESEEVGDDMFSIGYDGYNRCVWHGSNRYQIRNSQDLPRWQAGDVVGCLIQMSDHVQRFQFFLNGQPIRFEGTVNMAMLPYHAAVSLKWSQQVHFNFGQYKFLHPPKNTDYYDFVLHVNRIQLKRKVIEGPNFENATITNSVIAIRSKVNISKNLLMVQNGATSSLNSQAFRLLSRHTCDLCNNQITTQLLRFVCCDIMKFGHECVESLQTCPEHKKAQLECDDAMNIDEPSQLSTTACKLCENQFNTQLLRFTCCDHFKFCHECAPIMRNCPKHKNMCA